MKGAEAPRELGSGPWLLRGKTTDPLTSCEVDAMAELMTGRLAELVSARLSDGRRVALPQSADEVHDSNRRGEQCEAEGQQHQFLFHGRPPVGSAVAVLTRRSTLMLR